MSQGRSSHHCKANFFMTPNRHHCKNDEVRVLYFGFLALAVASCGPTSSENPFFEVLNQADLEFDAIDALEPTPTVTRADEVTYVG